MLCSRLFSDWRARLVADLLFAILDSGFAVARRLARSGPKEPRIIEVGLPIVNAAAGASPVVTLLAKWLLND